MKCILLYDGACGFCGRVVAWTLRHDTHGTLYFAALHSPLASTLLRQQPQLQQIDSVMWVEITNTLVPQRILCRSSAALRMCAYLGGWWNLLRIAWIIPRPWRDWAYDVVARNRHRLLHSSSCELPPEADRQRFLENTDDLASQRE